MALKGSNLINILAAVAIFAGVVLWLKPFNPQTPEPEALFTLGGNTIGRANLPPQMKQALQQLEQQAYNDRQQLLEAAAVELYIQQQAEQSGEAPEQVAQRLLPVSQPAEEQLQAFYSANQHRIPVSFEQAKGDIARFLQQQQRQQQQQQLIAKLVSLNELTWLQPPPESDAAQFDTTGYPSKGPQDAKVHLVEFADYQCPHCKHAHEALKPLLEPYLDRIRYSFMDFPINRSGISRKVAEGAVCADAQQQFWAYQDLAFRQQDQLNSDSPSDLASQLGLDMSAFATCLQEPATAAKVKHSEQQAIAAGVTGTPSFFINGVKLQVQQSLPNELITALEQALQH